MNNSSNSNILALALAASKSGGGGGGAVDSVNGKTGDVVLTGLDIRNTISGDSLQSEIIDIENDLLDKSSEISTLTLAVDSNTTEIQNLGASVESLDSDVVDLETNKADITALAGLFKNATYNGATGVITFTLVNDSTIEIDLPLELIVESGMYNPTTKNIELNLANGDKILIPAADLVTEYLADGTTITLTDTTFSLAQAIRNDISGNALAIGSLGVEVNNKVDKVAGKGLSEKDFTLTLFNKLSNIENFANYYTLPTASPTVKGGVKVDLATSDYTYPVGADGLGFLFAKPLVKFVTLTQEEYDALPTKDPDTFYDVPEV